jgi:hypothetical protein
MTCSVSTDYGVIPRVEAGYNTSTVALQVAEGDEKGTRCPGVLTGPPHHWGV